MAKRENSASTFLSNEVNHIIILDAVKQLTKRFTDPTRELFSKYFSSAQFRILAEELPSRVANSKRVNDVSGRVFEDLAVLFLQEQTKDEEIIVQLDPISISLTGRPTIDALLIRTGADGSVILRGYEFTLVKVTKGKKKQRSLTNYMGPDFLDGLYFGQTQEYQERFRSLIQANHPAIVFPLEASDSFGVDLVRPQDFPPGANTLIVPVYKKQLADVVKTIVDVKAKSS